MFRSNVKGRSYGNERVEISRESDYCLEFVGIHTVCRRYLAVTVLSEIPSRNFRRGSLILPINRHQEFSAAPEIREKCVAPISHSLVRASVLLLPPHFRRRFIFPIPRFMRDTSRKLPYCNHTCVYYIFVCPTRTRTHKRVLPENTCR